ncbi:serine dehydratase subunit alpha family protein [Sulfurospirillum arcachonense]|uniref:L-cysteine desulfidase family protein n=1 Tax=Sulfurospirillum arcachonense TaxID=57666 RepID=UPI0004684C3B|nr:L-serine ammonia-lyase, iron-sulfur-dependent, subunit alpha [Sulfurospirillum arcachonense]
MDTQITEKILNILEEEVVVAEGCTEPIALAYVGAKVRDILDDDIEKVTIKVSGNMIKNVKSVVIPNSGGKIGIETSVVMGIIAGDAKKDLMVISDITKEDMQKVQEFLQTKKIEVIHEDTDVKLYAKITLESKEKKASVEIKHLHTNITHIEKNGEIILDRPCNDADFNSALTDRKILNINLIYSLAKTIELNKIEPLFTKVIALNSQIAREGLMGHYGVNIGKIISDNIEKGFYGDDARNRASSFASAGSDARMSGCSLPVMTTSGSGNQGMTSSLPLIEYARINKISQEKLIRALFFSHLATIHIKTNVGRLSAYCGVICSAAAVAGALAFLNDERYEVVANSVINTLGNVSGIICDGAKSSCAMKISTTTNAAFDSYILAKEGRFLQGGDGIIAKNVEETLKNIGKLSQDGMNLTDKVIINIMNKS